eukprot:3034192-Rhodomonas_salina.2
MSGDNNAGQRKQLDAAAMLDGMEFDLDEFWSKQKELALKEGMAGNAHLMTARAFVDAKKTLLEGNSMTEVTKQFSAMHSS